METKKIPFFIKLKNAIINFDEYKTFSEEKSSLSLKYVLKLVLIFTFIITIALTWKVINEANSLITDFKNECPEFSFQNNILILEGENKKVVKGDENGYFGVIVDSEKENLKDKVILKDIDNVESSITYEQLGQSYDINSFNKGKILQFLSRR